jgi:hypothetical protein
MQDTKLQPVVQTPAWIGIAIWLLIAAVVGLLALNVATLTNDKVHSTGYSMLERVLGVALSAAALGDFLANSPLNKRRTEVETATRTLRSERDSLANKHFVLNERHRALTNEHADLQGKHKKLSADHDGLKAQSLKRAEVARKTSMRIGSKVVAVSARGVSTFIPRIVPVAGAAVSAGVLAWDIVDLCDTMKALGELDAAFEHASADEKKVCGLSVPKWN